MSRGIPAQRASEHLVRSPVAINIRGQEGADAFFVGVTDEIDKAIVGNGSPKCMKRPPLHIPKAVLVSCIGI